MDTIRTNEDRQVSASDGFILIAVLWIIATLAVLASVYSFYVRSTVHESDLHDDQLRSYFTSTAAVELGALQLLAKPDNSRPHSGRYAFKLGNVRSIVHFESESGRVDLNASSPDLLGAVFTAAGADSNEAASYARSVFNWRSGFISSDPNVPRRPARQFQSPLELYQLNSIPEPIISKALPFVTTYTASPKLDIFATPEQLLSAIPAMPAEHRAELEAQLRASQPDEQRLSVLLGGAQAFVTFSPGHVVRFHVENQLEDGYRSSAEVVLLLFQQGTQPYAVLSWREGNL